MTTDGVEPSKQTITQLERRGFSLVCRKEAQLRTLEVMSECFCDCVVYADVIVNEKDLVI